MNWVWTFYGLAQAMDDLTEVGASPVGSGILQNAWMGLGQLGTPAPSPGLLIGDIVEANYDGYARQAVVWFPTFVALANAQTVESHNLYFAPTDLTVPNTITTIFLATALTGGALIMAAALVPPFVITAPEAAMIVKAVFQLPFTPTYGGPVVQV